jgi:uncharacterized integral membrane protein
MSSLEAPRRPKGKPDPAVAIRKVRVAQLLAMQGLLTVLLLFLAFLSREDRLTSVLMAWTIVVPLGFAYVYGTAYRRHENAKRTGAWTKEWDKKETTRGYSLLGVVFGVWVAGVLLGIVLL